MKTRIEAVTEEKIGTCYAIFLKHVKRTHIDAILQEYGLRDGSSRSMAYVAIQMHIFRIEFWEIETSLKGYFEFWEEFGGERIEEELDRILPNDRNPTPAELVNAYVSTYNKLHQLNL